MLFPEVKVVNVSDKTGQKIAGPVMNWSYMYDNDQILVELLEGMGPNNEYTSFYRKTGQDWKAEHFQQKIVGTPAIWMDNYGTFLVEYFASMTCFGVSNGPVALAITRASRANRKSTFAQQSCLTPKSSPRDAQSRGR